MKKPDFVWLMILALLMHTSSANSQTENYTYKLSQSTSSYQFWTTTPADKVFKDDAIPIKLDTVIRVYAAKNEFEPFQLIVKPDASGDVTVTIGDFGPGITTELYQVEYVNITNPTDYFGRTGDYPDPLWPIDNNDTINLTANENTSFWFNIEVGDAVPSADYTTQVTIGGISIPVVLHVFNFAISDTLHVKSQMNMSYRTIQLRYGVNDYDEQYWFYVKLINQFMIDHRLTPKGALWPGGVTSANSTIGCAYPFIDYDCEGKLDDQHGIWGFEEPAKNYLDGDSLESGVGFPSFMAASLYDNDPSLDQRKDTFCDQPLYPSDWLANPNSAYNQEWFQQYWDGLEFYLDSTGYLDKAYYYFANEPQDTNDYKAVAWYSRYLKEAAPDLRLMVSEEPKPGIYNDPNYVSDGQVDIWTAFWGTYCFDPDTSLERMQNHQEESWIYYLKSTYLPRFNPITIDHPGIEGKLNGWFLWKYRARGITYYQFNNWNPNPWYGDINPYGMNGERFLIYPPSKTSNDSIPYGSNGHRLVPSIRLEMIRDGFEDYEYLYEWNNQSQPQPFQSDSAEHFVDKVIKGLTAYTRNSEYLYNLRRLIGLYIGGEISFIPDISPEVSHARAAGVPGDYYINFQDPDGDPTGTLIYNGHEYSYKIGKALYSADAGYGWYKAAEVPETDFYNYWDQWVDPEPKKLLGSGVIDSWGRQNTFEFDLPNGVYTVTVCVGYRSSTWRVHRIIIEDEKIMDHDSTSASWITRTKKVTVKDKKLTIETGGIYDKTSHINYLDIEADSSFTPILSVTPGFHDVSDSAVSTTFSIANLSDSTDVMFWTARVIDPDTAWLSIAGTPYGNGDAILSINVDANFGNARSGSIVITADNAYGSPDTVLVNQDAGMADNLILQNITVSTGQTEAYLARNSITAAGSGTYFIVQGTGNDGGEVTFNAGNEININEGFEAAFGSKFNAEVDTNLTGNPGNAMIIGSTGLEYSVEDLITIEQLDGYNGVFDIVLKSVDEGETIIQVFNPNNEQEFIMEMKDNIARMDFSGKPTGVYTLRITVGKTVYIGQVEVR